MRRISIVIMVALTFVIGCGTIKEQTRMSDFDKMDRAYRHIMLESDYETAMGFTDSEVVSEDVDYTAYEKFKIVDYQVKKNKVSEDKLEITRTIQLKYSHCATSDSLVTLDMQIPLRPTTSPTCS